MEPNSVSERVPQGSTQVDVGSADETRCAATHPCFPRQGRASAGCETRTMLSSHVRVRLIHPSDTPRLTKLRAADAEDLRTWDPPRPTDFYTIDFQKRRVDDMLANHAAGTQWPGVITFDNEVIGTINLHNVLRGPFQSAFVGYWVATPFRGSGAATSALTLMLDVARRGLDLHRLEAYTQPRNQPSQTVLERNGFEKIGVAKEHIYVDGSWRDEIIWQRLLDAPP